MGSIWGGKTEAKSRKMPSKFDVIFDVRFGRGFFTLGVDFSSILGWFLEAKTEPRGDPTADRWKGKKVAKVLYCRAKSKVRPVQEQAKIYKKATEK